MLHCKIVLPYLSELDDKLIDVLRARDSSIDENKFRDFCQTTNDMFHPHAIDHYGMNNYAKSLFRAALWQSQDRASTVEQVCKYMSPCE